MCPRLRGEECDMTIARSVCLVVLFLTGLGVGVLWSPIERPHTPDGHALSDMQSENRKFVTKMRETFGEETATFAEQFEDLTIRFKEYPVDVYAAPDGRFDIRLHGSDETIASDLLYPDRGGVKTLVRHYVFSNGDGSCSCDFGRSIEDSKMSSVVFDVAFKGETKFFYLDTDGDCLWDRFTDLTQEPPRTYIREGLGWKWREVPKDSP